MGYWRREPKELIPSRASNSVMASSTGTSHSQNWHETAWFTLPEVFHKTQRQQKLIGVEHIMSAAAMENEVGTINRTLRIVLTHRQKEHFDHATKSVSRKLRETVFHQAHQPADLDPLPSKNSTDTVLAGTYHSFDKRVGLFGR